MDHCTRRRIQIRKNPAARNAAAEARAAAELIEKKDPVILVTSAFHMRRAKALFQGRGIKIIPAPAGHLVDAGRGDRHIGNQLPGSKYLGFAELALWEHLGLIWFSVTSNHIHLLVYGNEDREVIPRSLQLIAGRTAQAYNRRKNRNGAFWEDRYHATAVDTDEHLIRCLVYIDMNMVRAGVVKHPREWPREWRHNGYHEIINPPRRYRILSRERLKQLLDINERQLVELYPHWVDDFIQEKTTRRHGQKHWLLAVFSSLRR